MCTRSMNDHTSILSQVACTCNEVWNSWSGICGWGNYLVLFLLLYFTELDLVEMVVSAFPPPHHHNSYYCEHRHCHQDQCYDWDNAGHQNHTCTWVSVKEVIMTSTVPLTRPGYEANFSHTVGCVKHLDLSTRRKMSKMMVQPVSQEYIWVDNKRLERDLEHVCSQGLHVYTHPYIGSLPNL